MQLVSRKPRKHRAKPIFINLSMIHNYLFLDLSEDTSNLQENRSGRADFQQGILRLLERKLLCTSTR